jgi:branched-chain amino acid transport system substrate-binding protein
MQAMKKIFAIFGVVTLLGGFLAACQTGNSPWESSGYSRPAKGAPSSLIAPKYRSELRQMGTQESYMDPRQPLNTVEVGVVETPDSIVAADSDKAADADEAYGEGSSNWPGVWEPEVEEPQDQYGAGSDTYSYETSGYQSGYEQQSEITAAPVGGAVRVALLAPLSGEHQALGEALLQAAQLALFDMEFESLEILPRDTQGTTEGARMAAESAIADGAQLILGPLFAGAVDGAKPVARQYDVNMIAFSTDWTLADSRTFIMGFLPFAQVQRVAEYAAQQGIKDIGILTPNTGYGNAVIAAYNSLAYRLGLNTAEVERFAEEGADFSEIVKQFTKYDFRKAEMAQLRHSLELQAELNPKDVALRAEIEALKNVDTWGLPPFDAVLLPVGGDQARSLANLLSFYDLGPTEVRRLGTGLWDDPGLATEPAFEGAWFAAPQPEGRAGFMDRYKDVYGRTPPRLATLAYDATALVVVLSQQGFRTVGYPLFDSRSIANPNGFAGLDGIFRFRSDGLVERGLAVQEFHKGSIRVIDPAPTSFEQANIYQ